jgi:hypothetical protein
LAFSSLAFPEKAKFAHGIYASDETWLVMFRSQLFQSPLQSAKAGLIVVAKGRSEEEAGARAASSLRIDGGQDHGNKANGLKGFEMRWSSKSQSDLARHRRR